MPIKPAIVRWIGISLLAILVTVSVMGILRDPELHPPIAGRYMLGVCAACALFGLFKLARPRTD